MRANREPLLETPAWVGFCYAFISHYSDKSPLWRDFSNSAVGGQKSDVLSTGLESGCWLT